MLPIRFTVFFTMIMCICAHGYSQIKGSVTDGQSKPVTFALVVLRSLPDSLVLKTELTDTSGSYAIAGSGKYPLLLSVVAEGYQLQSSLVIAPDNPVNFTLSPSDNALRDITVTGQKKLIERKIDRTVFNVENSVAGMGSDAFELLKKAPGVRVNNGEVSIAGKSTVSVMINDRLLQLSGDELESMLRSMPSDDISRIEVITTPPAKYDAQGNTGIINIVTKRSSKDGFNGNVTGSYGQRVVGSESVEGAFNWRQGKLNVFGNGNSTWFNFTSPQNITTLYPGQQQQLHLDQLNAPWYYRADVGADYNLTNSTVIGIRYTNGNLDKNLDQAYTTNVYNTIKNRIDSVMYNSAHTKEYGHRDVINLNYEWKIDSSGKKLNIDADYFNRNGNTYRLSNMADMYTDGSATGFANTNSTYGYNNILMKDAKLDLLLPTHLATFSIGGKISSTQNTSENIFSNIYGGNSVLDTSRSDHFRYTENIQSLYASAQKAWGKWEAKAGLRAEYTQTEAVSAELKETNKNEYLKLFPTAYLQYKKDDNNSFGITYSRRIDRPDFWIMNPFREYLTYNSYDQGNPFLQPAFSNNLELNYTYKSNYTVTLFAQQVEQQINRLAVTDTVHDLYYYIQANSGTARNYGISIAASFNPTRWWEGNAQAFGYYNVFSSSYYGQYVQYAQAACSAEMNNSFVLNKSKTLVAELGFNFTSLQQANYEQQRAEFFVSGGIKALLCKKQLAIALSTEDPFRTNLDRVRNLYNGTTENNYFDARVVQLAVTLKFGNKYIKEKRDHQMSEEDAKRVR